jgi:hypothetical protein
MSFIQRVSYHQVTLQFEDFAIWKDQPEREYADEQGLQRTVRQAVRLDSRPLAGGASTISFAAPLDEAQDAGHAGARFPKRPKRSIH